MLQYITRSSGEILEKFKHEMFLCRIKKKLGVMDIYGSNWGIPKNRKFREQSFTQLFESYLTTGYLDLEPTHEGMRKLRGFRKKGEKERREIERKMKTRDILIDKLQEN